MVLLTKQIIHHPRTASWFTAKENKDRTLFEVSVSGGGNPSIIDTMLQQGSVTKRLVVWDLLGVCEGAKLVLEAQGKVDSPSYDSVAITFGTPHTKE